MCNDCAPQVFKTNVINDRNRRIDPTQTIVLRKSFEADFNRRFAQLSREIVVEVYRNDGFGLKTNRAFDFPTSQAKIHAFMSWLNQRTDVTIYGRVNRLPRSTAANQIWMNTYIQSAYRRGMQRAANEYARAGGVVSPDYVRNAFLRPVHADRAGIIYTRSYDELRGITAAMDTQISRVLSEGIIDGRSPFDIARNIVDRVEKIGRTRARLLARTEVIAAHAEAKLNVYEDAKIQGIGLETEWLTAGDDRVCPECEEAAEAGPYAVGEAHGMIPLHPNCRCTWIPIIQSTSTELV